MQCGNSCWGCCDIDCLPIHNGRESQHEDGWYDLHRAMLEEETQKEPQMKKETANQRMYRRLDKVARKYELKRQEEEDMEKEVKRIKQAVLQELARTGSQQSWRLTEEEVQDLERLRKRERTFQLEIQRLEAQEAEGWSSMESEDESGYEQLQSVWQQKDGVVLKIKSLEAKERMEKSRQLSVEDLTKPWETTGNGEISRAREGRREVMAEARMERQRDTLKYEDMKKREMERQSDLERHQISQMEMERKEGGESLMQRQFQLEMQLTDMEEKLAKEREIDQQRQNEILSELDSKCRLESEAKIREMEKKFKKEKMMAQSRAEELLQLFGQMQVQCQDMEIEKERERQMHVREQVENKDRRMENEHDDTMQREEERKLEAKQQRNEMEQNIQMQKKRQEKIWRDAEEKCLKKWEEKTRELETKLEAEQEAAQQREQQLLKLRKEQKAKEEEVAKMEKLKETKREQKIPSVVETNRKEIDTGKEWMREIKQKLETNKDAQIDLQERHKQVTEKTIENEQTKPTIKVMDCLSEMKQKGGTNKDIDQQEEQITLDRPTLKRKSEEPEVKPVTENDNSVAQELGWLSEVRPKQEKLVDLGIAIKEERKPRRPLTGNEERGGPEQKCVEQGDDWLGDLSLKKGEDKWSEIRKRHQESREKSRQELEKQFDQTEQSETIKNTVVRAGRRHGAKTDVDDKSLMEENKQEKLVYSGIPIKEERKPRRPRTGNLIEEREPEQKRVEQGDDWLGDLSIKKGEDKWSEIRKRHQESREKSRQELEKQFDQREQSETIPSTVVRAGRRHGAKRDADNKSLVEVNKQEIKEVKTSQEEEMDWLEELKKTVEVNEKSLEKGPQITDEEPATQKKRISVEKNTREINGAREMKQQRVNGSFNERLGKSDTNVEKERRSERFNELRQIHQKKQELVRKAEHRVSWWDRREDESAVEDKKLCEKKALNIKTNKETPRQSEAMIFNNTEQRLEKVLNENDQREKACQLAHKHTLQQRQREAQEREKQKEKEAQIELEKQSKLRRQREMEREKEAERLRQDRQKQIEIERQLEIKKKQDLERQRQMERENEITLQKAQEKRRKIEIERQLEIQKQEEFERQREMEREKEIERQKQQDIQKKTEIERQFEIQKQKEHERQRKIERRKEAEKQKQDREEKQKEMGKQHEIQKQKELDRQRMTLKEKEFDKQKQTPIEKLTLGHQKVAAKTQIQEDNTPWPMEVTRQKLPKAMYLPIVQNTRDQKPKPQRKKSNDCRRSSTSSPVTDPTPSTHYPKPTQQTQAPKVDEDAVMVPTYVRVCETVEQQTQAPKVDEDAVMVPTYVTVCETVEQTSVKSGNAGQCSQVEEDNELRFEGRTTPLSLLSGDVLCNASGTPPSRSERSERSESDTWSLGEGGEGFTESNDAGAESGAVKKSKSVRRKVLGWINKKAKNYYQQKIERTHKREQMEGHHVYHPWYFELPISRGEREQQKRQDLMNAEEKRQKWEDSWRQWEAKRAEKKEKKRAKKQEKREKRREEKQKKQQAKDEITERMRQRYLDKLAEEQKWEMAQKQKEQQAKDDIADET